MRLVLAGLLLSTVALAADPCVKVTQQTSKEGLELWAELSSCSEVVISVTADETNVTNALPATVESAGRARFLLARWQRLDRNEAWRVADWKYKWKLGRRLSRVPDVTGLFRKPFEGTHKLIQGPYGTFSHFAGSQDEEAFDWAMPEGTPVLAARDGVVVGTRSDCTVGAVDEALKNDANYVVLRHQDGTFSEYHHLREGGVRVKLGERVTSGQLLGESGNTGYTSRPHLHFSVFHTLDGHTRATLPVTFSGVTREPAQRDLIKYGDDEAPAPPLNRRPPAREQQKREDAERALKEAADALNTLGD
ncbi:MAG: M23 family metallopeptidase [Myxococcaceae bacterium]|nr:M23 family metallopeptidase [Myxococcaceae bacterium]